MLHKAFVYDSIMPTALIDFRHQHFLKDCPTGQLKKEVSLPIRHCARLTLGLKQKPGARDYDELTQSMNLYETIRTT